MLSATTFVVPNSDTQQTKRYPTFGRFSIKPVQNATDNSVRYRIVETSPDGRVFTSSNSYDCEHDAMSAAIAMDFEENFESYFARTS